MVFLNWVWAYFTYGLGARLITGRQRQDWTGGGRLPTRLQTPQSSNALLERAPN